MKESLEVWLKAVNTARAKLCKEPVKLSELVRAVLEKGAQERPDVGL